MKQFALVAVLLLPLCRCFWYSFDDTVTAAGLSCQRMDDDPKLGRLCTVERAYHDWRMQKHDNNDFLGSTPLLHLQVPATHLTSLPTSETRANAAPQLRNGTHVTELTNFFGDISLEETNAQEFQQACELADMHLTGSHVVFLVRDHSQMGHFLTVQLAPLIAALKAVGWDKNTYQLVLMDRRGTHPPFQGTNDLFLNVLQHISGTPPISFWDWPQTVCLEKGLVGVGTHKMLLAHEGDAFFSQMQTDAQVAFNRDAISDMREAIWATYGIATQDLGPSKDVQYVNSNGSALRITIVDRGAAPQSRRIVNQDELLAIAQQYGHARLVVMQRLSFQEQIHLMSKTDIFVGTHGSAIPMMVFLPSHGVTVELKAYRHGLVSDYTHGHCNLARAANRTLLEWHNKRVEHTRPWEGPPLAPEWWKQHHTLIPTDQIHAILSAAVDAVQQPTSERDFNEVNFLNSAEVES